MTEVNSTTSHLSVAMTTEEVDDIYSTHGSRMTSPVSSDFKFYFKCAVIFIGAVGMATNALVLYALVASKQHKKHVLIVNQNALDLFNSFFLVINFVVKLLNLRLTGTLGYWLCMLILSEYFVTLGNTSSIVNLAAISIDRYLKVVHHRWSKKRLRPWMIYSVMAFAWLVAIVHMTTQVFETTRVVDGVCYGHAFFKSRSHQVASTVFYVSAYYVVIIAIFIFCYGRILMTIRRQASLMAAHSDAGAGPSTAQTQSSQMQSSVIKTKTQSSQMQSTVIKTMIFVCAFFAVARLPTMIYVIILTLNPGTLLLDERYYVSVFISYLYTCTNPFIYAVKLDPVRQILVGMIPRKRSSVQSAQIPWTTSRPT